MEVRFDCPRDNTVLARRTFRGIAYGYCSMCDGLWFTRNDLASPVLSEAMTEERQSLAPVAEPAIPVAIHTPCPACRAPAMRPFKVADTVIDICRRCGGVWLDAPEFRQHNDPAHH